MSKLALTDHFDFSQLVEAARRAERAVLAYQGRKDQSKKRKFDDRFQTNKQAPTVGGSTSRQPKGSSTWIVNQIGNSAKQQKAPAHSQYTGQRQMHKGTIYATNN